MAFLSMFRRSVGRLTARAPSSGDDVLGLGTLAIAVESGLLAARALCLLGADAAAFATAASGGDGSGGRRHC